LDFDENYLGVSAGAFPAGVRFPSAPNLLPMAAAPASGSAFPSALSVSEAALTAAAAAGGGLAFTSADVGGAAPLQPIETAATNAIATKLNCLNKVHPSNKKREEYFVRLAKSNHIRYRIRVQCLQCTNSRRSTMRLHQMVIPTLWTIQVSRREKTVIHRDLIP
jgi:hypothetical protein